MPNRPDHPDFWLISQTLIDNDTAMDQAVDKQATFKATVNAVVDIDSATYAADQRVLRAFGNLPNAQLRPAIMSLWLDAFVAGAYYYKLKTEGGQTVPENVQ